MARRSEIQIPIFDSWFLFNVYKDPEVREDIPEEAWASALWEPFRDDIIVGPRKDPYAYYELARLLKFKTCPFCRSSMPQVLEGEQAGILLLCEKCNYWGGRGTRGWGFEGPKDHRGILGRYKFINEPDKVPAERLIRYFHDTPTDLLKLTPAKAEKFVVDLVRDALDCDARLIGGVKDNGVDGIIIRNEIVSTIIQIKWRESSHKAEAVSVVREVAGTLLAHGVPNGMIISTRSHFSKAAIAEAEKIGERIVTGVGRLRFDLKSFDDIVGMLEVKCRSLDSKFDPEKIIGGYDPKECIFDNH